MHAEAAPESAVRPAGEGDRSGEGEAGGKFGEREHISRYAGKSLSPLRFHQFVKPLLADTSVPR